MINSAMMLQDYELMMHNANYLLEANPLDANAYDNVVMLSAMAADNSMQKGDKQKAKTYLQNALNKAAIMDTQKKKLNPARLQAPYWQGRPLEFSSRSYFELGKASYLLGKYQQAEGYLQKIIDNPGDLAPEINAIKAWYFAGVYKNGRQAEGNTAIQNINDAQAANLYSQLISLKPLD